jgi:hypothetical protein
MLYLVLFVLVVLTNFRNHQLCYYYEENCKEGLSCDGKVVDLVVY